MAFVNRFEPVCNDATDFFAIIQLFYLLVNRHLVQDRVEFFQLDTVWSVLFIFSGDVTRRAGFSGVLMLGTF
tara:strand:+ start:20871 stop:21086 length:216 start_codon:yes stop_codon:yes gene_type:complete